MTNKKRAIHASEVLKDELVEINPSAHAFAKALDVPTNRMTRRAMLGSHLPGRER